MEHIQEEALVLIPALFVLGVFIKRSKTIADKYIPFILLIVGIALSIGTLGLHVHSVVQGILVSGAAVLTNELVKQSKKPS